ncbi:MAG: hypothetical protein S0880_30305 [Actinomycetota bacterium]|nr:hypothetical protein [Actinomycetota bacterium]
MDARGSKLSSVAALLATAVASGGFAALVAAGFIWLVEGATELLWVDLPDEIGVDPFDSWWIIAVPVAGGLLVGLCQLFVGDHPKPLEHALATWRSGGQLDPAVAPKTFVSSLAILVAGGPVGFEAALIGLLGGTASFIGGRIRSVGRLVRQAWGAERIDQLPPHLRQAPYWLTALTSVLVYRWLPFGAIDMGFRFDQFDGELGVLDTSAAFVFAMVVTVPAALVVVVVGRAEHATLHRRSPILAAMAGALAFALLGLGNELVLFSGQEGFQQLPDAGTAALLYITVAKVAALLVALVAGWRGGPIFPLYTSVGALAVVAADLVDARPELLMVAALAAVSTVLAKGNIAVAAVLTVYVVPVSFALVILLGCAAAVVTLALARATPLLRGADDQATEDEDAGDEQATGHDPVAT